MVSESAAKIDGGCVNWKAGDGGPEFKVISFAVALVAVVPSGTQIHRERPAGSGGGAVHRARPVPLQSGSTGGHEAEQIQNLLHRDVSAQFIEVDSGHRRLSPGALR